MYRNCKECGKPFNVIKSNQVFCSNKRKCSKKWHRRNDRLKAGDTFQNRMKYWNKPVEEKVNKPILETPNTPYQGKPIPAPIPKITPPKPLPIASTPIKNNKYSRLNKIITNLRSSSPIVQKPVNKYYAAFDAAIADLKLKAESDWFTERYLDENLKKYYSKKYKIDEAVEEIKNKLDKLREEIERIKHIYGEEEMERRFNRSKLQLEQYLLKKIEELDLDYIYLPYVTISFP